MTSLEQVNISSPTSSERSNSNLVTNSRRIRTASPTNRVFSKTSSAISLEPGSINSRISSERSSNSRDSPTGWQNQNLLGTNDRFLAQQQANQFQQDTQRRGISTQEMMMQRQDPYNAAFAAFVT